MDSGDIMAQRQINSDVLVSEFKSRLRKYSMFCRTVDGLNEHHKLREREKFEEMKTYIRSNRENINLQDRNGNTPLHICLKDSSLTCYSATVTAALLLDNGAVESLGKQNRNNETPFSLCVVALNESEGSFITHGMFEDLLDRMRFLSPGPVDLRS